MHGHYDLGLVALSFFVAMLASFSALYFGAQVSTLNRSKGRIWLALGALTMGTGIWTMHFVGMRAHIMPIDISYGLGLTLISWVAAVFASALALHIISLERMHGGHLILGSLVMGGGIASMHYVGMGAMHLDPGLSYDPLLFVASIAIAVGASAAALLICRQLQKPDRRNSLPLQVTAATVMAIAICGMHYTGMFAVIFPENAMPAADNQLAGGWLGVPLSLTISVLIAMALLVVGLDMKVRKMLHQEAHQQAEKLQQMAFVDQASQLPNRSALEQALLKAMVVDQDAKQGFALLYLSMQNYRDIEDQLSDQDMSELATHLGILSQPGDFLARYASNSFVLMISNPKASRLENINKRLEILAYQVQPGGHSIDWRAGFSRYPHDGSASRSLIRKAMANAQPLGNQLDTQPSELAIPAT